MADISKLKLREQETAPFLIMKIQKISWRDITAGHEWMELKEATAWGYKQFDIVHVTVGYVIFECRKFLLVAGTYSEEEPMQFNDISMIMKSVIIKRE